MVLSQTTHTMFSYPQGYSKNVAEEIRHNDDLELVVVGRTCLDLI